MERVIPLINLSQGLAIADHPEENRGQFVCNHRSGGRHCYEAIDNTEAEGLRTEVFYRYEEAVKWLKELR